jgi:hypothetical protein
VKPKADRLQRRQALQDIVAYSLGLLSYVLPGILAVTAVVVLILLLLRVVGS